MMNQEKVIRIDGFVKRPSSRRANLVECGVLSVRRSDSGMKRNAEIGLFTKLSIIDIRQDGQDQQDRKKKFGWTDHLDLL
ncbi:MAG TPA: hypothetical protein VLT56_12735 [Desulfobacterales bacterium]|nr:hypothetical protein [Desulfobacterales bacterium]